MVGGRTAAWVGWGLVALLAVAIGVASLRYLSFSPEAAPEELRANLVDHPVPFLLHTTLATIALLVGVWQFLPVTRRGPYHRWAGRTYVASVIIASIAGFAVALTTQAGRVAGTGFMILAVLWLATTVTAYLKARARDFDAHREWMIRSYALTSAAISLRLILPLGVGLGFGFTRSYIFAAWACWIVNLAIAETIIRLSARTGRPIAGSEPA